MRSLLSLFTIILFFGACDEVTKNEAGDIIVIGNNILKMNNLNGVLLEVPLPNGAIGTQKLGNGEALPLVSERKTDKPVDVHLGWVSRGEKDEPIFSLSVIDQPDSCRVYETLQSGELVCRVDLKDLKLDSKIEPRFFKSGNVIYVSTELELRSFRDGVDSKILDDVDRLWSLADEKILVRTKSSWTWVAEDPVDPVKPLRMTTIDEPDVIASLNSANQIFVGKDGHLYFLLFDTASQNGLYELSHTTQFQTKLVAAMDPNWNFRNFTEPSDASKDRAVFFEVDNPNEGRRRLLVRADELGFHRMETEAKLSSSKLIQPSTELGQVVTREVGKQFVSEYCEAGRSNSMPKSCSPLPSFTGSDASYELQQALASAPRQVHMLFRSTKEPGSIIVRSNLNSEGEWNSTLELNSKNTILSLRYIEASTAKEKMKEANQNSQSEGSNRGKLPEAPNTR